MASASISSRLETLRRKYVIANRWLVAAWCMGVFSFVLPPVLYAGLTARYGKQKVDSFYLFKGSRDKQVSAASPPLYRASFAGFMSSTAAVAVCLFYAEGLKKQIVRLEVVAD